MGYEMQVEEIEMKLLVEAIYLRYGYDFRAYAEASFKRRIKQLMMKAQIDSISVLMHKILYEPDFFMASIPELTVGTSEMFRDPGFFQALRKHVLPVLKTYPAFKIWHAGCSTGEEVYSLAIMLREEGLSQKSVLYATDVDHAAIRTAKEGIYPLEKIPLFTSNYQLAQGRSSFSDYYSVAYGAARFDPSLRQNIVFFEHNLATDAVFSEIHLILCRNVLIYFKRDLQARVLDLFTESLVYKGFLGLGSKETVNFLAGGTAYEPIVEKERIYRKIQRDPQVRSGGL